MKYNSYKKFLAVALMTSFGVVKPGLTEMPHAHLTDEEFKALLKNNPTELSEMPFADLTDEELQELLQEDSDGLPIAQYMGDVALQVGNGSKYTKVYVKDIEGYSKDLQKNLESAKTYMADLDNEINKMSNNSSIKMYSSLVHVSLEYIKMYSSLVHKSLEYMDRPIGYLDSSIGSINIELAELDVLPKEIVGNVENYIEPLFKKIGAMINDIKENNPELYTSLEAKYSDLFKDIQNEAESAELKEYFPYYLLEKNEAPDTGEIKPLSDSVNLSDSLK